MRKKINDMYAQVIKDPEKAPFLWVMFFTLVVLGSFAFIFFSSVALLVFIAMYSTPLSILVGAIMLSAFIAAMVRL